MVDAESLSQVLGAVELSVGIARRVALRRGDDLALPAGAVRLVYVVGGTVHGHPPLASGCQVDLDPTAGLMTVSDGAAGDRLTVGDAFLTLGGRSFTLESDAGATLLVVDVELSEESAHLKSVLPEFITVLGFDSLEPSAAALVDTMGHVDREDCSLKSGDPVICRMMVTTVLLSVIRAWAANGCAPEGWPSVAKDPFLDRVVEAIHDRPGQEWTVERLANVGAMSRSVFAERFRTALGRSPASYVTEVRIASAKRMLAAGRSVSEVSRELGYASDEGFRRAFRRHTGMTPTSWRLSTRAPAARVPASAVSS